ncbi:MAG: beta-propeller fold lactonase family protein [Planctomycetota bacterium]
MKNVSLPLLLAIAAAPGVAAEEEGEPAFVGGVFAMTNEFDGNRVAAYGRADDGTLTLVGLYPTGGLGAAFDGGEGLDPLISAYSLLLTDDNKFLLAVNAGSDSVTVFQVNDDLTLTKTDEVATRGVGPNAIAHSEGLVYVACIDADGAFAGEPDQEGSLHGYRLTPEGQLMPMGSGRRLGNRPSAVQFSPDGAFLIVSSINAGSIALASGSQDEIAVFGVRGDGTLTRRAISAATSTPLFNPAGRNLPSAIGFEVVESGGAQYVVVTEAREFQSDGSPPAFDALQTGSISTWELASDGSLNPVQLDVLAGDSDTDGQRTACWIEFSADQSYFWVSNALEATLSTFSFSGGTVALVDEIAAYGSAPAELDPFGTTDGWIDLWISADGKYLYQLFGLDGSIGVFRVEGSELTFLQKVSGGLPDANTQGIVAF